VSQFRQRATVPSALIELRWRQILAQVPDEVRANVELEGETFDPLLDSIRRLCLTAAAEDRDVAFGLTALGCTYKNVAELGHIVAAVHARRHREHEVAIV
jgi:hypothetical protein